LTGRSSDKQEDKGGDPSQLIFNVAKLTDSQFQKFSELIYNKTGIFLKSEKKELLNARLGKRLRACGMTSFEEYFTFVTRDGSGEELVHLIDQVSTNFTNFFREQAHFDLLEQTILPQLANESRVRSEGIRIWSSACSSGEEPYTLGMVVSEFLARNPGLRCSILATDISTKVLNQAKHGVYSMDKVAKIPPPLLKKYFQKGVGNSVGFVKVKEQLRQLVDFRHFNLMQDFSWGKPFDVIFCRNVMIYFNRETQQRLIEKFYNSLGPAGYLVIGHSESISSIKHNFKQLAATAYRK